MKPYRAAWVALLLWVLAPVTIAQAGPGDAKVITIDATRVSDPPPSVLALGGKSPTGHTVAVNSRYLLLDAKPWLPVMAEFHYSRYPAKYWEEELQKMKAGGVQIVATYVFWIHHEEVEGEFDWSGQRNLRHFVELAGQNGLLVWVRIGPYGHGEVRNGGLPDWLLKKAKIRRNDATYLSYVDRYFHQLGQQVQGLFWKDGGPIIGVQLENEYFARGPDAGAAHIGELKRLANQAGIEAPLYTVTGWDNPEFPAGEVIPVFGGYPDNFWYSTLTDLPPSELYLFDFTGVSLQSTQGASASGTPQPQQYPFFMAEAAGGMQVAYHRRPSMRGDDVAAVAVTRLGSGANLYGYYMYQGGANPEGKLTTLQESVATDHVYDLPVVTYDFQAPLGQFGQMNEAFRATKPLHLFLADFGSQLAPMMAVRPQVVATDINDRLTPRLALRAAGDHGFLFFNNYQRHYPLPEHKQVQFEIKLPGGTLRVPRSAVDVPSGAYFIWPVNLGLNGVLLKYASAQLLTKVQSGDEEVYCFFQQPGIAPEFAFDRRTVQAMEANGAVVTKDAETAYVNDVRPGTGVAITLRAKQGRTTRIVLLTQEQARNAWKALIGAREHVVLSPADVFFGRDGLHLRARDPEKLDVAVFPPLSLAPVAGTAHKPARDGLFIRYRAAVKPKRLAVAWRETLAAAPSHPVQKSKEYALAPTNGDFARAGVFQFQVPKNALTGLSDLFLRVRYLGDVARLYKDGRLLMDDFYNGSVWEIGMKRFAPEAMGVPLEIKIMPLRKDAPVYLPRTSWPEFPVSGEITKILDITAEPEYEVIFQIESVKQ